jgi:tetratricopeptide (TPR) repeat protein
LAWTTAIQVGLDVRFGKFQSRRAAVHDHADATAVRFAPRRDAEQLSKAACHAVSVLKKQTAVKCRVNLSLATWRRCLENIQNFRMATNTEDKIRSARELCEKGLWQEVLTFAEKWHRENPADYQALYYTGLGFSGLGQFLQAETAYRQALALDATDPKVWNNLAGILFEKMQRPADGISCIQQTLKLNPADKIGWSNLATMVGRLGHHDKAMLYADRAIALDAKFVEAYLHKATAARALGKVEVVKEVCNALAAIEPEKFHRAR